MDQEIVSPRRRNALTVVLVSLSVGASLVSAFLLLSLMGKASSCTIQLDGYGFRFGIALGLNTGALAGIFGAGLLRPARHERLGPGLVAYSWLLVVLSVVALAPFIAIATSSGLEMSQIQSRCGMSPAAGVAAAGMSLLPLALNGAWASLLLSGKVRSRVVVAVLPGVVVWTAVLATLLNIQSQVTG